jgi:hypothetical protein
MQRWKNRDNVSSQKRKCNGARRVQECACSFDDKQAGKEDQQRKDNGMERSEA